MEIQDGKPCNKFTSKRGSEEAWCRGTRFLDVLCPIQTTAASQFAPALDGSYGCRPGWVGRAGLYLPARLVTFEPCTASGLVQDMNPTSEAR